ncbi:mitochondrial import inner membrane translocase subunit Tim29 [Mauremys reevesii]|uniref:mitochondrial import inner membrane translocase subunit Tim29 n=1 Tax=Mauremys reevesii TaxID=260615 RepID=UPI00193EE513|nr:mitochondrial import inner membrane translocase subunit Tim29 [Mauremys reevesii]
MVSPGPGPSPSPGRMETTSGPGSERPMAGSGSRWQRIGTGRLGLWCRSLLQDYADACRDVALGVKEQPGKAGLYLSLLAGATVCSLHVPCDASFESSLLEASGALLLLSPWVRNGRSEGHVQRLMKLRNQGRLRYQSLVFFSLVYQAPFDAEAALYQAHCKHLKPRWTDFPARILDVGFLGRWWVLSSKMKDSDINEEEFKHLPEHLRTISSRNLHSAANEKLFDEKYKPVILTEEQIERAEKEQQPLQGALNQ